MFGYDSLIDLRNFESFLFEGPEVAEQIFERDDSFNTPPLRKRSIALNSSKSGNDIDERIVYSCVYDKESDQVILKTNE